MKKRSTIIQFVCMLIPLIFFTNVNSLANLLTSNLENPITRISEKKLLGEWISIDSIPHIIEFTDSVYGFTLHSERSQPYYFTKDTSGNVLSSGFFPLWPPLNCDLEFISDDTLKATYSQMNEGISYLYVRVKSPVNNAKPNHGSVKTICVDYREVTTFNPDEESFSEYAHRDVNYLKNKIILSDEFVKEHLLLNADSIIIQNIWTGDSLEKIPYDKYINERSFYLIDTILKTGQFNGIVYEEIGSEGSEKNLFTYDKSGKFVSKISIAFYQHSGSSTNGDGSRSPWYEKKKGCIENNALIYFISQVLIENKFNILPNGKIIKIE